MKMAEWILSDGTSGGDFSYMGIRGRTATKLGLLMMSIFILYPDIRCILIRTSVAIRNGQLLIVNLSNVEALHLHLGDSFYKVVTGRFPIAMSGSLARTICNSTGRRNNTGATPLTCQPTVL